MPNMRPKTEKFNELCLTFEATQSWLSWVWDTLKSWFHPNGQGFAGPSSTSIRRLCDHLSSRCSECMFVLYIITCTFVRMQNNNAELFLVWKLESGLCVNRWAIFPPKPCKIRYARLNNTHYKYEGTQYTVIFVYLVSYLYTWQLIVCPVNPLGRTSVDERCYIDIRIQTHPSRFLLLDINKILNAGIF